MTGGNVTNINEYNYYKLILYIIAQIILFGVILKSLLSLRFFFPAGRLHGIVGALFKFDMIMIKYKIHF